MSYRILFTLIIDTDKIYNMTNIWFSSLLLASLCIMLVPKAKSEITDVNGKEVSGDAVGEDKLNEQPKKESLELSSDKELEKQAGGKTVSKVLEESVGKELEESVDKKLEESNGGPPVSKALEIQTEGSPSGKEPENQPDDGGKSAASSSVSEAKASDSAIDEIPRLRQSSEEQQISEEPKRQPEKTSSDTEAKPGRSPDGDKSEGQRDTATKRQSADIEKSGVPPADTESKTRGTSPDEKLIVPQASETQQSGENLERQTGNNGKLARRLLIEKLKWELKNLGKLLEVNNA